MKKFFLLSTVLFFLLTKVFSQDHNVGIGTLTPEASAILELKANDKGILIPRLTTTERIAILNPATGLLVYDINFQCFFYYNGSQWLSLCSGGGSIGATGSTGVGSEIITESR